MRVLFATSDAAIRMCAVVLLLRCDKSCLQRFACSEAILFHITQFLILLNASISFGHHFDGIVEMIFFGLILFCLVLSVCKQNGSDLCVGLESNMIFSNVSGLCAY